MDAELGGVRMCQINKALRIVLGLSFLPGRLRSWLFHTGSRLWEVFNIILLLIFGLTVFTDSGAMFNQPAYRAFVGIGGDDAAALDLFHRLRGAQYDYIGLLGFVLPWNFNDHRRMYCFEWCALAMGLPITARITPERLLAAATQARSSRAFSRPEA